VAKVYRLFRNLMGTAVGDGLLRVNPVNIKGAAVEHSIEGPLLPWRDVGLLAKVIHPRFSALVWTAASSGLRFGELTGLTLKHIELGAARVRVDQSLTFIAGIGPSLGPPKSDAAYRTVSLPGTTHDILQAHVDSYVNGDGDALVFTTVDGKPLLNRYFAPYWQRAKADAGVDPTVRFHDLRHLAGTTAASAGASLRGHVSHGPRLQQCGTPLLKSLRTTRRRNRKRHRQPTLRRNAPRRNLINLRWAGGPWIGPAPQPADRSAPSVIGHAHILSHPT